MKRSRIAAVSAAAALTVAGTNAFNAFDAHAEAQQAYLTADAYAAQGDTANADVYSDYADDYERNRNIFIGFGATLLVLSGLQFAGARGIRRAEQTESAAPPTQ